MNFNDHSDLKGKHCYFSPSRISWINYDEEKLIQSFLNSQATLRGTEIHDHAAKDILFGRKYGIKRPSNGKTYETYVNDAIGYRMIPEQPLVYSKNFFGTADAISFRKHKLRIHDLKTGETPSHIEQLEIYAALFCLEYQIKPETIEMELRIYQSNNVFVHKPEAETIQKIMDKIKYFDEILSQYAE